tara:strand:- start:577 stop:984 length:408 start_codon:yes stop_codon:yes gene_type:complete
MNFDDLNEKNFLLYAMQHYNNPQCIEIEEFNDDLKKIKYIKRLFNQYLAEGTLKERLLLNHIIIFYNVFPPKAATRILFYKIEEKFWPILKTFLFYLKLMPEDKIESIMGREIKTSDISFDQTVVDSLRKFDRES